MSMKKSGPSLCPTCLRKYQDHKSLIRHCKKDHGDQPQPEHNRSGPKPRKRARDITCPHCHTNYTNSSNLQRHLKGKHPELKQGQGIQVTDDDAPVDRSKLSEHTGDSAMNCHRKTAQDHPSKAWPCDAQSDSMKPVTQPDDETQKKASVNTKNAVRSGGPNSYLENVELSHEELPYDGSLLEGKEAIKVLDGVNTDIFERIDTLYERTNNDPDAVWRAIYANPVDTSSDNSSDLLLPSAATATFSSSLVAEDCQRRRLNDLPRYKHCKNSGKSVAEDFGNRTFEGPLT